MAKDIWERKPAKMLSTELRDWLAELQEEWNVIQEKADKLESVKKYLDTIVIPSVSDITNLKEILADDQE